MATQTTGGGSVTSFTNTPQAKDDNYLFLEDVLRANSTLYNVATNTITLDVMANDLGGTAKSLFSVEDGDGNALTADYDLLVKDVNAAGVSPWEETFNHNWVRINNGKIEYRIADGSGIAGQGRSVDSLTAGQAFADQFVYAIRLGNGTLSEATVKINITGANDIATIAASGSSDNSVIEAGGVANATVGDPFASGKLMVSDADLGQNFFQNPSAGSLNGIYGTFTFDSTTGQWTYALNNSDPDTQALAQGASATETLTVMSFDGTASYNIVVNITGTNDAPITINLYHNLDFVFNNPCTFPERTGQSKHFEGEGEHSTWTAANTIKRNLWETNFVHDLSSFKLYEFEERGKGSTNVSFILADGTMHAHVSQIPKGRYKKAHRHAAGTHVHAVDGEGYSLLWHEGDSEFKEFPWRHGFMYTPPFWMFHQHFNTGPSPARYLACSLGSRRYPFISLRRKSSEGAGSISISQGGRQIEYEDQDPRIHRKWLEALGNTGVASEMGEIFDEPAILELPAEALSGVIRTPRSIGPAV